MSATAPIPNEDNATPLLLTCIERLEELIDDETNALVEHRTIDLAESNRRKNRALLELTRIARALPARGDERIAIGVARLRVKLLRNRELLNIHIAAVREVADLLARAVVESESDGTYSARLGAAGK